MPAILDREDYAAWLGETEASTDELTSLLKPCRPDLMEAVKIGPAIGNVKNDGRELVELI